MANGAFVVSTAAVDNATDKALYAAVWVALDSFTPGSNPYMDVYIFYSHDGTNYEDEAISRLTRIVASPEMTTGLGGKGMVVTNIPIAPFKFHVALANRSGATLAAANNSVLIRTYNGDVS